MKKSIVAGIVVIALAVVTVVVYIATRPAPPPAPSTTPPVATGNGPQTATNTASNTASTPATSSPAAKTKPKTKTENKKTSPSKKSASDTSPSNVSAAERYCANPAKGDVKQLTAAGGVVQIFEHDQALKDPYGCAAAYLKAGGDINAVDPSADGDQLTPLLYAIKQNDPKMVRFTLKHGADPNKRASTHHIAAYGYAIFLALHNQNVNYNPVIDLVNNALDQSPASGKGS